MNVTDSLFTFCVLYLDYIITAGLEYLIWLVALLTSLRSRACREKSSTNLTFKNYFINRSQIERIVCLHERTTLNAVSTIYFTKISTGVMRQNRTYTQECVNKLLFFSVCASFGRRITRASVQTRATRDGSNSSDGPRRLCAACARCLCECTLPCC